MSSIFGCGQFVNECVELIAWLYFDKVVLNITEDNNDDECFLLTCL